jgi:tRNA/tmRNA/rRNA uracil-C5-methylase (TrmA/RlmC/RlmD family)
MPRQFYGIEIVPPAITDARRNAEDNHCDNATFLLGDAAKKLPELLEQEYSRMLFCLIRRARVARNVF